MKKLLSFVAIILTCFLVLFVYQYQRFITGKLQIIICDVGQGDSALIITPERQRILIDGGPDQSVLACLSEHLPFWERSIDVMLLTHPHADHLVGMHYVLDRYTVKRFISIKLKSPSISFRLLQEKLTKKGVPVSYLYEGNIFTSSDSVLFRVLSPNHAYLASVSPSGEMKERAENASLITHLSYGKFTMLFAGDSPSEGLQKTLPMIEEVAVYPLAHHGSKTSTTEEILIDLSPELVIASMGEGNDYGHPSPEVVELVKRQQITLLRTDQEGDIEISTDGKAWSVK